jgi:hypothetical protein
MFWNKEKVLYVDFDKEPETRDRRINIQDKTIAVADKKGNIITLEEDKKLYPFKIDNTVACTVQTNYRLIQFKIPEGYRWNGADIPKLLWVFVGSQFNPEFKVPSMIHDYMLEFKQNIYEELIDISVAEYRRLTSLAFRQALKNEGVRTVKANIMAGAVQGFQTLFNRGEWEIG